MLGTLLAGCGCFFLLLMVAVVTIFLFVGNTEDLTNTNDVNTMHGGEVIALEEHVELVDLLIDGGCRYGELHTEEDEACTLPVTCDDVPSCIRFGNDLVSKLEQSFGSLTAEDSVATNEDTVVIMEYDVDLDKELLVTKQTIDDNTHLYDSSLWYSYAWLIPEHARSDMTRFEVFESGDTLAYVYLHDDYGVEWTLGMNREDIELASETMVTYIHEFGHLVSLRNTEINYYVYEDECESIYLENSCYYNDAYMVDFYQQFYAADNFDYTSEYFVSDYAITSMIEDFAESFAHFVLSPQPAGNTVTEQKLLFFYDYEYFVFLRAEILARAATWLERTEI